jgi:hypothetical protein
MTRFYLLLLLTGLAPFAARGQTIQNLSATFLNGKVIVAYDITGAKSGQTYSIDLYSSHNNFTSPVKQVTGDVGKNISAGVGKRITWDVAVELIEFSGDLTFKLKGEMIPLPLSFKTPTVGDRVRKGKSIGITWEGGKPDQMISFELYKGNDKVMNIGDSRNTGQFAWLIPKDFSKGTYSVKLKSGDEVRQSGFFNVKPRTPLLVKLLPLLAAGGAAALLSGGGEKSATELPAAPNPN